jgi:hypothetical protein
VSSDEFETFNFNYVLRKTIDVKWTLIYKQQLMKALTAIGRI